MHGLPTALGCLLALAASASGFLMPGPSSVISGRQTRGHTSQVIFMGRGDTRTKKGKRMRHTYGKCRPRHKKKAPVYHDGELVVKPAPVARRWEAIEWVESEVQAEAPVEAAESSTFYESKADAVDVPEAGAVAETIPEETEPMANVVVDEPEAAAVTIPESEPMPEEIPAVEDEIVEPDVEPAVEAPAEPEAAAATVIPEADPATED